MKTEAAFRRHVALEDGLTVKVSLAVGTRGALVVFDAADARPFTVDQWSRLCAVVQAQWIALVRACVCTHPAYAHAEDSPHACAMGPCGCRTYLDGAS